MARRRVIDQNAILDAAETVVTRDGAANLTIDAVACEAHISKASVVYDYKSKQQLIKSMVKRRMQECIEEVDAAQTGQGAEGRIRAYINVATPDISNIHKAIATQLCSSWMNDEELVSIVREYFKQEISLFSEATPKHYGPLLAFLAIEGLRSIECFGSYSWQGGEREQLLAAIGQWASADLPPSSQPEPTK